MQPIGLQEWIHKLEEGEGNKVIRLVFFALALLGLTALWHLREAKNFVAIEAMDSAQVARNLSEGKGYSTSFIRPFSVALIEQHRGGMAKDVLKSPHPDLANAPLYPTIVAGLLKVMPLDWNITSTRFWRFQPEWFIGGLNQLLFFGALILVFRLSARLFDKAVGYLAVVLMGLTELFWEFTTSGLSTILLMVLFLWLVDVLVRFEIGAREGQRSRGWLLRMAAYAGAIVGLMALTRYSMGWLIVPVAIFLAATAGGSAPSTGPGSSPNPATPNLPPPVGAMGAMGPLTPPSSRGPAAVVAVVLFALVLSPWLWRNYNISGTLFGTAGYALHHGTSVFPGHTLERSMPKNIKLELNKIELAQYPRKLFLNGRDILTEELPRAAGNWIGALFFGAMLIPFRNPALARLKYFVAGTILSFVVVQALGRTSLSAETPVLNSENLIVVLTPIFFIFGCGLFFILLDQVELPAPWFRTIIIVGFVAVLSLPMIFRLLPPRSVPVTYPPYWPPLVQEVAHWMQPEELMMSDMPWAVGWYGGRESIWTTLDVGTGLHDDFYRINDELRAIKGLYLTPITTNARFLTEMRQGREGAWGKFYLDVVVLKNLPSGFPLKMAPPGLLPDQLFLSDRIRWRQ